MSRQGFTLVELLTVLVLLGITTASASLAVLSLRVPPEVTTLERLRLTRELAISTRAPVAITIDSQLIRFLPDGRVLGGQLDPLTGEPGDSTR